MRNCYTLPNSMKRWRVKRSVVGRNPVASEKPLGVITRPRLPRSLRSIRHTGPPTVLTRFPSVMSALAYAMWPSPIS